MLHWTSSGFVSELENLVICMPSDLKMVEKYHGKVRRFCSCLMWRSKSTSWKYDVSNFGVAF